MIPTPDGMAETLQRAQLGAWADPHRLQGMSDFLTKMLAVNESINLTRLTGESEVRIQHVLDSAEAFPILERLSVGKTTFKALDLGTGCGFPGVALAMAFPTWEVTLMDATAKKIQALSTCLEGNVLDCETLHGRAEDVGRDPRLRESWDLVTARAVADLPVLLEYALPLLKVGGYLVDWMTEDRYHAVDKSENALHWLGGKVLENKPYSLPDLDSRRVLLVVEKVGKTPLRYPRLAGQPSKNPL